jgi:hypothetical protein
MFCARLWTGNNILNLTKHIQFRPCHFSFTISCNIRFELRLGIF